MRVIILTTERKVKKKKIRQGATKFTFRRKMYEVDPEAVFMTEWPGKALKKSKPTLFYFENNPQPVKHSKNGDREDESFKSLERQIKINAVNQQSGIPVANRLRPIIEAVGPYLTIYNVFIAIVALTLIWSYIEGAFLA